MEEKEVNTQEVVEQEPKETDTVETAPQGEVTADAVNGAMQTVKVNTTAGTVHVIDVLPGDVDSNGHVNGTDISLLRKYIAGGYGIELRSRADGFTVKFETGSGIALEDVVVQDGTAISTFPTPYWAEHIFVGWCYDAELKQPVASTDKVMGNMTLYANWLEQVPLDTLDAVNFASAFSSISFSSSAPYSSLR